MVGPVSIEEFAALTGYTTDELEDLKRHGLVDPDNDGLFDGRDLLRLQFVEGVREEGRPLADIADALFHSTNQLARRLFRRAGKTLSIEEVSARFHMDPARMRELQTALGFASDEGFDEDDLEAFALGKAMMDAGLPWEAMLEGARVYSDTLRRLADASLRMTHRFLCEPLAQAGRDEREIAHDVGDAIAVIEPSAEALVNHLLGDYLREAAVDHAISHLVPPEPGAAPGSERGTIVFVDLALFSSLADMEGDEAAVGVIDRFDQSVREYSIQHGGKLVKQIGDEFMLVFRDPAQAVRFAIAIHGTMSAREQFVALRTGIHAGSVLYRMGDYYGKAVNIASRIASMAMPNAILITEPVAKAAADDGIEVVEVGVRSLRGMEEPLPLYRVVPAMAD